MLKNYFSLVFLFIFLSSINAQKTYVPDDNFEQVLINFGYDDVLDDYVTTANISGVTELHLNDKNISDLTGIEDFVSLKNLDCGNNQLTSLDLSKNIALTDLGCPVNQLTSLDLTQNTSLTYLACYMNQLTSLDVTQNTALTHIYCSSNQLTSLDVTQNIILIKLSCYLNKITNIDVSNISTLTYLYCGNNQLISLNVKNGNNSIITNFAATNNPQLQCIQVDNEINAINGLAPYNNWSKDATATYSEDCLTPEKTYIPDDNFEQALIDLGYDDVLDDYVVTSDISGVTSLDVRSKNISILTGIEDFINLTKLNIGYNQLSNIDLESNTLLKELVCYSNQLSSIDLNQNTALTYLDLKANQLTNIDVSQNLSLTFLNCGNNQLTSLDVSNNTSLTDLYSYRNPINNLDVTKNSSLINLSCWQNELINLDVSNNTSLTYLECATNQLTSLDLTNNTVISDLRCYENKFTSLDISNNSALFRFWCSDNQLESLNVKNGNNDILTEFAAQNNSNLTCIQVDNQTAANDGTGAYSSWNKDAHATYSEDCSAFLGVDDEILSEGLNLYPNPVSNFLIVGSKLQLEKVEIYSILGQKVKEVNSDFKSISTVNLSRGIYMIRIYSEKGTVVRKLIKK